mgnify:FL=1|jgi:hypothetical protein|tara:strand:- start:301 stop:492 length:192 start_codon:yes stop_codon:yes gene_type:complete
MKIEVKIFNETGEYVVAKALEPNCQELIVNGMRVIQGGNVKTELRQLADIEAPNHQIPPLEVN